MQSAILWTDVSYPMGFARSSRFLVGVPPMSPIEFIALDLETTGLNAEIDRIVEIGAIRFDASGQELGRFEQLVNPGRFMPAAARAVHGISDEDLAGAPPILEVLPALLDFLGEPTSTALLAHHASFDAGFLGCEFARLNRPIPEFGVIDTLALARSIRPELPTHRLDYLTKLYRLDPTSPHRALTDSHRVKELWLRLGGPAFPRERLVTFPIFDPRKAPPTPKGWERLDQAIANGLSLRIEYEGGSKGSAPRSISPRRIVQRGGIVYVVAVCHLANFEKSFRLDRIRHYEVLEGQEPATTR